jgi:hypothetical protein
MKELLMIQLLTVMALTVLPQQQSPQVAPTPEEIHKFINQRQKLRPYPNQTADWPRYVKIEYAKKGSRWLGAALFRYLMIPPYLFKDKRSYIEGYQVEFVTVSGQRIRVSGKEKMVSLVGNP